MSRINVWESRFRTILNEFTPTPSQRKFILSCWDCLDKNPDTFPTRQQVKILANIWKHCQRVKAEEEMMIQVEAEELV